MQKLIVSSCIILLISCGVPEKKESKTGAVVKGKFELSSPGCETDSLPCAQYKVTYPTFPALDSTVAKRLKSKINASVSMGNPEADGWSMRQVAESFIAGFDEMQQDNPDLAGNNWFYEADVEVEIYTDTLLSLSVYENYYTGGAHGGTGKYFINIDPSTGDDVPLDEVLKAGYKSALTQAGEKAFRMATELPDSAAFSDHGYEFPNDQFQLNQNYGFTKDGILFFYNNYEIASYAAGPTQILIPYEEIKDWLK